MKKILVALLISILSFPALADGRHYHGGRGNWIAPAIIGAFVGYAVAASRPVYTAPVYVQPMPAQLPPPPNGYYTTIVDPMCNCVRTVWVQQ